MIDWENTLSFHQLQINASLPQNQLCKYINKVVSNRPGKYTVLSDSSKDIFDNLHKNTFTLKVLLVQKKVRIK